MIHFDVSFVNAETPVKEDVSVVMVEREHLQIELTIFTRKK